MDVKHSQFNLLCLSKILKELLAVSKESFLLLKSIDNKLHDLLKTKAPNSETPVTTNQAPTTKAKKLPVYKDPVFLAKLRKDIIDDHNKKIRAKK